MFSPGDGFSRDQQAENKAGVARWIPELAPLHSLRDRAKRPKGGSQPTKPSAALKLGLPSQLSAVEVASAAATAMSRIGVAAAQNEFDNLLSFLAGNDQADLIASNTPLPPHRDSPYNNHANQQEQRQGQEQGSGGRSGSDHHMDLYADDYELDEGDGGEGEADFDFHAFDDSMQEEEEEDDFPPELIMSSGGEEEEDEEIDDEEAGGDDEDEGMEELLLGDLDLPADLNRRLMAQLNPDHRPDHELDRESIELREEIMEYLRSTQQSLGGAPAEGPKRPWKLYGVDPRNELLDECPSEKFAGETLQCIHTRQPLQGSVTGSFPVFGVNGERLAHGFPDLSHMGLGARHVERVFVALPAMYTDLYQMVSCCLLLLLLLRCMHLSVVLLSDQIPRRTRGRDSGGPGPLPGLRTGAECR